MPIELAQLARELEPGLVAAVVGRGGAPDRRQELAPPHDLVADRRDVVLPDAAAEEAEVPLARLVAREHVDQVPPERRLRGERRRQLERPRMRCAAGIWAKSDSTSAAPTASSSSRSSAGVEFGMYGCAVMRPPGTRAYAAARRARGGNRRAARRGSGSPVSTCSTAGSSARSFRRPAIDLDVLDPDPAQDSRAELLVAATEQRALAADDADHERRRLVADQLEQPALGEIGAEQPARAHGIDAEQRLRQPEPSHHAARRRPRPEDVDPARIHRIGDRRAHGVERDLVRGDATALRSRHPQRVVGHAGGAVEPGRDRARRTASSSMSTTSASRTRRARRAAMNAAATSPAASGVRGEHAGVHLDARRARRASARAHRRRRGCRAPCRRRRRRGSGRPPRRTSSAAAARVSAAVVASSRRLPGISTSVSKSCRAARSAPIGPGAATRPRSAPDSSSRAVRGSARSAAAGAAPSARARASDRGAVGSLETRRGRPCRRSG